MLAGDWSRVLEVVAVQVGAGVHVGEPHLLISQPHKTLALHLHSGGKRVRQKREKKEGSQEKISITGSSQCTLDCQYWLQHTRGQ